MNVGYSRVDASGNAFFGLGYNEVEVTYTSGLDVIPAYGEKLACAQIVKNAQATPAMNVKSSRMEQMQMEYFSECAGGCSGAGDVAALCGGEAGVMQWRIIDECCGGSEGGGCFAARGWGEGSDVADACSG